MEILVRLLSLAVFWQNALCFWDKGTSTEGLPKDQRVRLSMFQWQVQTDWFEFWFPDWDWADSCYRRRMAVVAGISINFLNLGVGCIINRRTVVTSANIVEPYLDVAYDLRVWALGRGTYYYTPFRYRVWRSRRVIPKSNNPEHQHGPRGTHVPRHDIAVIHTREQMYLYPYLPRTYHYSIRALLPPKHMTLPDDMIFAGSGFEDLTHIKQNYKINYQTLHRSEIVDCSRYLTKWWGKFICFKANYDQKLRAGVPAGGPILTNEMYVVGVGCFEIRYNEDRISVFTDLRYYVDHIYVMANFTWGEYYEYAYQLYGNYLSWFWLGKNQAFIPAWASYIMHDNFSPLARVVSRSGNALKWDHIHYARYSIMTMTGGRKLSLLTDIYSSPDYKSWQEFPQFLMVPTTQLKFR